MENDNTKCFCSQCGAELAESALFCSSCGAKQENAKPSTALANNSPAIPAAQAALQSPHNFSQQPPQFLQPQGYQQQPMQQGSPMPPGYPSQGYIPPVQMMIAPKSMPLALILTFFFGPLGLLYANVRDGLILICISIAVAFLTLGFGLIFVWIGSMVWAYMDVEKYNRALLNGQIPPQDF